MLSEYLPKFQGLLFLFQYFFPVFPQGYSRNCFPEYSPEYFPEYLP